MMGRPPLPPDADRPHRYSVSLTALQLAQVLELGDGSITAGVRAALDILGKNCLLTDRADRDTVTQRCHTE